MPLWEMKDDMIVEEYGKGDTWFWGEWGEAGLVYALSHQVDYRRREKDS